MAIVVLATARPAAAAEPICADRPGKANGTCTVPSGMVQVETGLATWSDDGSSDELVVGETALKYGVGNRTHLELDIVPFVRIGGSGDRSHGFGDMTLRMKHRLTADSAPVQVALSPFVKLPTAKRAIGNGKVEAGLAMPIERSLSDALGLTLGPEVDLVADADGSGHHLALVNVAGLSVPLGERLGLSGEIWNAVDFDPADTTAQWSADAALAFLANDSLQLDAGINLGLNRHTPDVELYAGIAARF